MTLVVSGVLTGGGALGAVPATTTTTTGVTPSVQTSVMGPSLLNATQLAAWYATKRRSAPNLPNLGNDVTRLAQIYITEGNADGVRGDIAFIQSFIETAAFTFPSYGQIPSTFNNFAGIYAFNGRVKGTTCDAETAPSRCFASAQVGVRMQIQLLRGYADSTIRTQTRLIKPPADRIGLAPYWEFFGGQSGKAIWATAPNYGVTILTYYNAALALAGINAGCLPYFQGKNGTAGAGYWLFGKDGSTNAFGAATNLGDLTHLKLWGPIVSAEAAPDGKGYWMLGWDGGVFAFGTSKFKGSLGGVKLWAPVNDFATTPTGNGYWLSAYDGGIFTFGDAKFYGSLGGKALTSKVVSIEPSPTGKGYWLTQADGNLAAFGDAKYFGHLPTTTNVLEVKALPDGSGYYQLRADGTVAAFGGAQFYGDQHSCGLAKASHMIVSPTGKGYWIVSTTGSVLAFGDAKALGMPLVTTNGIAAAALQS